MLRRPPRSTLFPYTTLDQPLRRAEAVRLLPALKVPVIAPAALVVVADQPLPRPSIEQAVLQTMCAARHRFRHFPNLHFHDRPIRQHLLVVEREARLHMAYYAIY